MTTVDSFSYHGHTMIRTQLAELSLESLYEFALQHELDATPEMSKQDLIELIVEEIEEADLERDSSDNHPVKIEQMKYDLLGATKFTAMPPFGEEFSLPEVYNETRIVVMLRDPAWAFAYWDIHDGTLQELLDSEDFEELFLRAVELQVRSGGNQANHGNHQNHFKAVASFDIPVQPSDGSWYVHLPKQGTYYRIDLLSRNGGKTSRLALSNIVAVPSGNLAINGDDEFAERIDLILALSGLQKLDVTTYGERIPQRLISLVGE